MIKEEAIYNFWAGFGLPAYEENSVYSFKGEPDFPYITYELNTSDFGDGDGAIPLSASLWYKSRSLVEINAKTAEISKAIGRSGATLKCDDGYIWITKNSPFAQTMGDSSNDLIKRKVLNISAEFLTIN